MNNRTSKKAGTIPAYLITARRHLYSMAPGPGAELLLLIVIGGLVLWTLQ
jgi:hypothetical protein